MTRCQLMCGKKSLSPRFKKLLMLLVCQASLAEFEQFLLLSVPL